MSIELANCHNFSENCCAQVTIGIFAINPEVKTQVNAVKRQAVPASNTDF